MHAIKVGNHLIRTGEKERGRKKREKKERRPTGSSLGCPDSTRKHKKRIKRPKKKHTVTVYPNGVPPQQNRTRPHSRRPDHHTQRNNRFSQIFTT
jgi:hypothetical protein